MNTAPNGKILFFDDLCQEVRRLQAQGNVVVQSHGIFDLLHPGTIQHLTQARAEGDVLVVTVVKDQDVRRGHYRPIFPEQLRLSNVAALSLVDFVALVGDDPPFEAVRLLQPDVFARGQRHSERDQSIHGQIFEEEQRLVSAQTRLHQTGGFTVSATNIINRFLNIYPEETKRFIRLFNERYRFESFVEHVTSLSDLEVLVIGDAIIDEYCYVSSLGKSAKSHIAVTKFEEEEAFAGGSFAVANHLAGICRRVHLISLLGRDDSREDFIRAHLRDNVDATFYYREDGPTTIKRRYLHGNQKLFEINVIEDRPVPQELERAICETIARETPRFDLTLICDFGHGLLSDAMITQAQQSSRYLAVNAQVNAANTGFNLITKYQRAHFVCLDETEARLATQDKFGPAGQVAAALAQRLQTDYLIITLGKKGSIGYRRDGVVDRTPIFSSKVIDTVGAGDAFFSFTAPAMAKGCPSDFVSFLGNAVGALAVQIVGNRTSVEKHALLEFVHTLLSQAR